MNKPAAQQPSLFARNEYVQDYLDNPDADLAASIAAGGMAESFGRYFRSPHVLQSTQDAALAEIVEFCRDKVAPAESVATAADCMRDAFQLCAKGSLPLDNPALVKAVAFVDQAAATLPPISLPASLAWEVGYNKQRGTERHVDTAGRIAILASQFARVTGTVVQAPHFTAVPAENDKYPVLLKPDRGEAMIHHNAILYPYNPARDLVHAVEGGPAQS